MARHVALVCCALFVLACGGTSCPAEHAPRPSTRSTFHAAKDKKVCVVLSVGGSMGIAHLGALRAIQRSGLAVECVMGNSMGSLAGSLYASAPKADPVQRYTAFFSAYETAVRSEATDRGFLGGLAGLRVGALV